MNAATTSASLAREAGIKAGVRVEIITVVWMVLEAIIAVVAGAIAHSVLLVAFGLDSVIELVSGGALLWRLTTEARHRGTERVERAEVRAAWITGSSLSLLCIYIVVTSILSLLGGSRAEGSPVGIGVSIAALCIMPWLVWQKRSIADAIDSAALRGDAACSLTCCYMAGALLLGVALNTLFGLWWADSAMALVLLVWIVPEAREAFEGAHSGRGACGCEGNSSEA